MAALILARGSDAYLPDFLRVLQAQETGHAALTPDGTRGSSAIHVVAILRGVIPPDRVAIPIRQLPQQSLWTTACGSAFVQRPHSQGKTTTAPWASALVVLSGTTPT